MTSEVYLAYSNPDWLQDDKIQPNPTAVTNLDYYRILESAPCKALFDGGYAQSCSSGKLIYVQCQVKEQEMAFIYNMSDDEFEAYMEKKSIC